MHPVLIAAVALVLARWLGQLVLEGLNQRHVRAHAGAVPPAFRDVIDEPTYRRATEYTLAKGRLSQMEDTWSTLVLVAILVSGVLPAAWNTVQDRFGSGSWSTAGALFLILVLLGLASLPFDWWAQFRLEERFGFNTTTAATWWLDRVKGLLLSAALGWPLLALLVKLVEWTGPTWWLWGWGVMLATQLLMLVIAPILILPLFNKFTPLPEGSLRDRLLALGERSGFMARTIQVMDGSRRSKHSNAFFTGFGRFRKIVLFDTLIEQLSASELEAVLAHEIGHYKKKHIPKMLAWSAVTLLVSFAVVAWLARQEWFLTAFGFQPGNVGPAFLLFALLGGCVTFWMSPLRNLWSRRHEYEADAFAVELVQTPEPLVGALRKLNEKNLSNLTPHPLYSSFYYSHPTLPERERALKAIAG